MSIALPFDNSLNEPAASAATTPVLIDLLLREQQSTAVDKFAQWHGVETEPLQARYYRDLIPTSFPKKGEQYAFEVDLDNCSGCKACVVACHNLNGLEEHETWRSVGLLHGGTGALPVLQHVTTACHHCLEPACLDGCPVYAYEKDPMTGIVRHLDDQCIGCQYCILKCPYDVPRYSPSKGIVRKCDMCSDRLAVGEAPACVQACPNGAIRITLVDTQDVAENAEANLFLPGAPEPGYTLPTTVYRTARALPANLLPADYYSAAPQHAHWPLVWMLVLTQMSVGAFLVDQVLVGLDLGGGVTASSADRILHVSTAFLLGMIGLAASTFHLGRPWLAYRAILGWRTSWLSREVIAFGGFALSASCYASIAWLEFSGMPISPSIEREVGVVVALFGVAGVACSTMIYASTRRVFWNPFYTGLKFLLTCLVLGIPVALILQWAAAAWSLSGVTTESQRATRDGLCVCLIGVSCVKLLAELAVLGWLRARTFTPLRRTALLLTGQLKRTTATRFAAGAAGGLLLPGLLLFSGGSPTGLELQPVLVLALVVLSLGMSLLGETLERYLFFASVVAPKMPGAPSA